jgi:hypothetical protein
MNVSQAQFVKTLEEIRGAFMFTEWRSRYGTNVNLLIGNVLDLRINIMERLLNFAEVKQRRDTDSSSG